MVGLDVGTMNLISAYTSSDDQIEFNQIRNAFIKVERDKLGAVDLSNITHAEIDDELYILGNDAFNFANIFGATVNRPMSKGLISSQEIDAVDALSVLINSILPFKNDNTNTGKCVFSCPANSIDTENDNVFHREVIKRIITSLGYEPEPMNEALAIIYAECKENLFSGIAISFGAGMTNVCLAYKSIPAFSFSVERGGDWIDHNASLATNVIPNRICSIKELPTFSITNWNQDKIKKSERRIREALSYYYTELINYCCNLIISKIANITDIQLPDSLPIIISGGTSLVDGFIDKVKDYFDDHLDDIPFDISEIRYASDPLTAVAHGCLIKSML